MVTKVFFAPFRAIFIALVLITSCIYFNSVYADTACGKPNYDSSKNRGIFLWKNCSTNKWFLRAAAGGRMDNEDGFEEYRVEGSLRLSKPAKSLKGFRLDTGKKGSQDLLDKSNALNIKFRFRTWAAAQDGIDFELKNNTIACLHIATPSNPNFKIGQNPGVRYPRVINIDRLNRKWCVDTTTAMELLLYDET